MLIVTKKIEEILLRKGLSKYKLSQMINYKDSNLNRIIYGKQSMTKRTKEKLMPILEVSEEELESWIIADKYHKEVIKKSIFVKKNPPDAVEIPQQKTKVTKSPILTAKIDKLILEKQLSRTKLSKLIEYDQITLNRMILGAYKMSDTVIERLSEFLEISKDDIKAWVLADKYSLEVLYMAWDVCNTEGYNT